MHGHKCWHIGIYYNEQRKIQFSTKYSSRQQPHGEAIAERYGFESYQPELMCFCAHKMLALSLRVLEIEL